MQQLAFDRIGAGAPLVLLHPLGLDRHVWSPVLARLASHRDVLAVDLPGFGDSPPLPDGEEAHPRRLAEAVARLLRELGIGRGAAHVAGCSLGGWVALELALAGDAASVTALAPAGLWTRELGPKAELARGIARLARPLLVPAMRVGRIRRLALASSVAHPDRVPPGDAARLIRAYATGRGFSAANRAMRAGRFDSLASISVPLTLVWPGHDRLIRRPRSLPSGVREIALDDCGHIPMWDDPAAVAAALLDGSASQATAPSELQRAKEGS